MSFEPVTMWHLRCDGDTTSGQCAALYQFWDPEDDEHLITAMFAEKTLVGSERAIRSSGWEVLGDRVLCPDHVSAAAQMVDASLNGLPFESEKEFRGDH